MTKSYDRTQKTLVPQTSLPVGFYLRKKETGHATGRAVLCWARIWLCWGRGAGLGVGSGRAGCVGRAGLGVGSGRAGRAGLGWAWGLALVGALGWAWESKVVLSVIWFNWFTCTVWGLCWYNFFPGRNKGLKNYCWVTISTYGIIYSNPLVSFPCLIVRP